MSWRALLTLIAVAPSLALAGCMGGEDEPAATDDDGAMPTTPTVPTTPTGPGVPPGGNVTLPKGTPVNETKALAVAGPGPAAPQGHAPVVGGSYSISPGFTSFTIALEWSESGPGGKVAGLGSVKVEVRDANNTAIATSSALAGPNQMPQMATMEVPASAITAKGDYSVVAIPQDPAARGTLTYTIMVNY